MLFLLAPGLLFVQAARPQPAPLEQQPAVQIAALIGQGELADTARLTSGVGLLSQQCGSQMQSQRDERLSTATCGSDRHR